MRPPKRKGPAPFWWEKRGAYYIQVGGKQVKLSADPDEAERFAKKVLENHRRGRPLRLFGDLTVLELCDQFLDWCQKNKNAHTYRGYRRRLQHFIDSLKEHGIADIAVSELRPHHVTRAMDAHEWGANTKADFVGACQRVMNWGIEQGHIDRSPIARMKKTERQTKDVVVSPAEYAAIMAKVVEPTLRDLVELTWETGLRVQEARKVEARFVDLANRRIVFPPKEAKGKKYFRIIYLGTDRAMEIVRRLVGEHPEGPILRNSGGTPWTKDAINCAFCRLEKKLGKKYHLGAFRKGFASEALKNGVDVVTLSHLMGHRDPSMVSKVYAQVQQDPAHMAEMARRAKGR